MESVVRQSARIMDRKSKTESKSKSEWTIKISGKKKSKVDESLKSDSYESYDTGKTSTWDRDSFSDYLSCREEETTQTGSDKLEDSLNSVLSNTHLSKVEIPKKIPKQPKRFTFCEEHLRKKASTRYPPVKAAYFHEFPPLPTPVINYITTADYSLKKSDLNHSDSYVIDIKPMET